MKKSNKREANPNEERHPYRRLIQIVGSIISVISTIYSFVMIILGNADDYSVIILFVVAFISIIGVALYTIVVLIKDKNREKNLILQSETKKLLTIAHTCHEYCGHLLRDSIFKVERLIGDGVYSDAILLEYLRSFCKELSEYLYTLLCAVYDQQCVVNVRLIAPELWDNLNINDKDKENISVHSYGRMGEDDAVRRRLDEKTYKISDDAALTEIFIKQKSDFCRMNVSESKAANPDLKYLIYDSDSSLYNNILVVPIRIKKHVLLQSQENLNINNLFGFISVDFKNSDIGEDAIKFGLDFLKTFADSSYLYIENIRRNLKLKG